ncbi:MAG TPA: HGGxSTG domain-containing protein [Magnetospirillum sp.]|nr:HGGxSTG domain-containing protein [Magnetospirillum sp.]
MHQCPRCGARTRKGTPCQSPAVTGRKRCRMHGGADGSGAPAGNRNALKHGHYTAKAIEERRALVAFIRECRDNLATL